ncbi:hypothetical protein [Sorangium sp. So ce1099]
MTLEATGMEAAFTLGAADFTGSNARDASSGPSPSTWSSSATSRS